SNAVDEDVLRLRQRILWHRHEASRERADGGGELDEISVAGAIDHADAADEPGLVEHPSGHADRAIDRDAAGVHGPIEQRLRIRAVVGLDLADDDAEAAAAGIGRVAWLVVHDAVERASARQALAGVPEHAEVAAAVRLLDAVERRDRRVLDAGREVHAADEA